VPESEAAQSKQGFALRSQFTQFNHPVGNNGFGHVNSLRGHQLIDEGQPALDHLLVIGAGPSATATKSASRSGPPGKGALLVLNQPRKANVMPSKGRKRCSTKPGSAIAAHRAD
jgi:hypothetical protein